MTRSYRFGDIDKYKEIRGRREKILGAIRAIEGMFQHPIDRRTAHNFLPFVQPRSVRDPGALPFYSHRPTSKEYNKAACIFSLISYVIQLWWCHMDQENGFGIREIDRHVDRLNKYASKGLKGFTLRGTPKTGYWLRERR